MDWGQLANATALFPSFTGAEGGHLPSLPEDGPVWRVLDPNHADGLKAQMKVLNGDIGIDNPGFFTRGEGIVIEASATVEAGAYLICLLYTSPSPRDS